MASDNLSSDQLPASAQPRVRHNDHRSLTPATLGQWYPHRPVSVVVPAHGDQPTLDLTLAALAAQTYPDHLLEVVVVDDGSDPPLRLRQPRPANTTLVRADSGRWGPAHAVHTGVAAAAAPTILRLDSDMIAHRSHVEAHMRWHHLADYLVVLGTVWFTPADGQLDPTSVHGSVAADRASGLFPAGQASAGWTARVIEETDGLTALGSHPFRVASGATISWSRWLYDAAGGMDPRLPLGSDTELGYRLAQAGAVFVPEAEARAWHLGRSQMQTRQQEGKRYRTAHLSQRIPTYRSWRTESGRQWQVPYVDVVVDAGRHPYEHVHATVAGAVAGSLPDVGVTIIGPWSSLTDQRRSVLDDPLLDLHLIRAAFGHDGRMTLLERVPATSAPTPFRLRLPVGLAPSPDGLRRLTQLAERHSYGLVQLAYPTPDGLAVARLERTAAVARALAVAAPDPLPAGALDDLVDEMYGSYWLDGTEWALTAADARGQATAGEER